MDTLPPHDQTIVDAIAAGRYYVQWVPLDLGEGVAIEVMADALMVACPGSSDPHGYRPSTTPVAAQLIADLLGACLLTPKLSDLIWLKADLRIPPQTQSVRLDAHGHALPEPHKCPSCDALDHGPWELCQACGEREHSVLVDEAIVNALGRKDMPETMLVADTGKPWCLCKSCFAQPGMIGSPYGWHVASGGCAAVTPGLRVIQPCRGAGQPAPHNYAMIDYAEFIRMWRWPGYEPGELLCGAKAHLVSHEGPLPIARLPGVTQPVSCVMPKPLTFT